MCETPRSEAEMKADFAAKVEAKKKGIAANPGDNQSDAAREAQAIAELKEGKKVG